MGKIDRSELLEYFLAEAEDYLNILSHGIPELVTTTERKVLLDELFRAAHTLKGAAAIVRLTVTSHIAHSMEDILETFKNGQLEVEKDVIDLLLSMLDSIAHIVRDISNGKEEIEGIETQFTERVAEVLARAEGPVKETEFELAEADIMSEASPAPIEQSVVVAEQSAGLVGDVNPPTPATEHEDTAAPTVVYEKVDYIVGKRKDDVEYFFGNFVRIDLKKIEEMFNLISEVTIMKNHMMNKTKEAGEVSEAVLFGGKKLLEEVNAFAERHAYTITDNVKYIDPLFFRIWRT